MMQEKESEYWYRKLEKFASTAKGGQKREAVSRLAYLDIALPHRGSADMIDIMMQERKFPVSTARSKSSGAWRLPVTISARGRVNSSVTLICMSLVITEDDLRLGEKEIAAYMDSQGLTATEEEKYNGICALTGTALPAPFSHSRLPRKYRLPGQ